MKSLKMNNNDLAIENRSFVFIDKKDAAIQRIKIRLTLGLTEWFLDKHRGIDIHKIAGKGLRDEDIKLYLTDLILDIKEITDIKEIKIIRDREKRFAEFNIKAVWQDSEEIDIPIDYEEVLS